MKSNQNWYLINFKLILVGTNQNYVFKIRRDRAHCVGEPWSLKIVCMITFDYVVQSKPMTYHCDHYTIVIIRASRFVLYHKSEDLTIG